MWDLRMELWIEDADASKVFEHSRNAYHSAEPSPILRPVRSAHASFPAAQPTEYRRSCDHRESSRGFHAVEKHQSVVAFVITSVVCFCCISTQSNTIGGRRGLLFCAVSIARHRRASGAIKAGSCAAASCAPLAVQGWRRSSAGPALGPAPHRPCPDRYPRGPPHG